jgi:TldD protein
MSLSTSTGLPEELIAVRDRLPGLVAALESRAPYAAALAGRESGVAIIVNDREQRISEVAPREGIVFSAWTGDHMEEAASSRLAPAAMEQIVADLRARAYAMSHSTPIDPGAPLQAHFATPMEIDPASKTIGEKLELCREAHRRAHGGDARIVNAQVSYQDRAEIKVFCNRNKLISQVIQRVLLRVMIFAGDGQQVVYDWKYLDGTGGLERLSLGDDDLARMRENATRLLTAERIQPGVYDVVCAPDVSGVIAHESFGHGVEMDLYPKGRALSQRFLGRQVAAPGVNLLEDPTYPGGFGAYFFDDEGQPATPTYVIRNGIFERGITDLFAATALDFPRSANGRRESFERKAYARMSNTYFARGATPVAEMLAGLDDGVYLEHCSSGMEDPKGWGVQVTCHYGREVKGGRFTGRLFNQIGMTGYVPDVLTGITAIGDDFALTAGACGKGHKEMVLVSSGGPHLRLRARLG